MEKTQLYSVPFLRLVNMMFKKLNSDINDNDIQNLLKKVKNSFGYAEKLFKEIILFSETEIIKRKHRSLQLTQFNPKRIKQSATFQGACHFYLKQESNLSRVCHFFVNIKDLLTSVRLVCGLPCMVNLNHRNVALLRNYIGARKFYKSEQQIIFMYF